MTSLTQWTSFVVPPPALHLCHEQNPIWWSNYKICSGDNALDRCGMQTASVIYVAGGTGRCFVQAVGDIPSTKTAVERQVSRNPLTPPAQGLWRKGACATCLALVWF